LQLLPQNETTALVPNDSLDAPVNPDTSIFWTALLQVYGAYRPGISQIWLVNPYMDHEIVGTIVVDPLDDRYLIFSVDPDTLPANTLTPVNSVINPQITGPNAGLPGPVIGVRYLLVDSIGSDSSSWGTIIGSVTGESEIPQAIIATAMVSGSKYMIASVGTSNFAQYSAATNTIGTIFTMNNVQPAGTGTVYNVVTAQANDILQFNADISKWFVSYDANVNEDQVDYVTNLTTQIQYRWAATPEDPDHPAKVAAWMKSYEGYYGEGDYSVVI